MGVLIRRTIDFYFKSSKEYIFLFLFPIVFITAEYLMMEKIFGGDTKTAYDNVSIYYEIENESYINEGRLEEILAPLNLKMIKGQGTSKDDIQVTVDNEDIKVKASNKTLENMIISSIKSYDRAAKAYTGKKFNNVAIKKDMLKEEGEISSKDYYGVTMISMFFITAGTIGCSLISKDKLSGIKEKLKTMGVSNRRYYISTIIGFSIIASLGLLPGYIYSYFILDTNWGGNPIIPYLSIISFIILFVSLVVFLATKLKNGGKVIGVLSGIGYPILGSLGGAFFPIDTYVPKWFSIISYISPLKWFNNGIMKMVYKDNIIPLIIGTLLALAIGIAIIAYTIYYSNKEELSS